MCIGLKDCMLHAMLAPSAIELKLQREFCGRKSRIQHSCIRLSVLRAIKDSVTYTSISGCFPFARILVKHLCPGYPAILRSHRPREFASAQRRVIDDPAARNFNRVSIEFRRLASAGEDTQQEDGFARAGTQRRLRLGYVKHTSKPDSIIYRI